MPSGGWSRWSAQTRSYAINNAPTITYVPVPDPPHDDFSSEPTTYTQLLASIRSAKQLKTLQHLVTTYSDRFDAVHVAAAVARLPHLLRYRPADLVDRSGQVVVSTPGVPRLRRKHGAQLRSASAQGATELAAQLDALLPRHVKHFFPRQAACTVWAFGELRRAGVIDRMVSLPEVLAAVTRDDMEPLRVHGHGVDYAQLLQGLAKLGHREPQLLARLAGLLAVRVASLQPRELQMVAWALSALDVADAALFGRIADELCRAGTLFLVPSGLASLFHAYAKAGVRRPDLLGRLAGDMIGQALLLAPQDVATTLWACSRLRFQHAQLFAVLGDCMVRSLAGCSDLEVSSALEALARLGYRHAPLMEAVAEGILGEASIGAEPVPLSRAIFAYGRLGCSGPRQQELVARLAQALALRLPVVQPEVLATACSGLDAAGYHGEEVHGAIAFRAETLLPDCSVRQLLPVLRCLDAGGHPFYQLAVATGRHLETKLLPQPGVTPAGPIELLFLCARQGVEDTAAADALMGLAAAHEAELRPADAARLLVVAQKMNRRGALVDRLAGVVQQGASSLDPRTAEAALQSAEALGMGELASALSAALGPV